MRAERGELGYRLPPRRRVKVKDAGAATLARGLQLLETFQQVLRPLSHGELASLSGLTGPTVTRLTSSLETLGYLRRGDDRKWELTPDVLSLGYPALVGSRLRRFARPYLLEIARQGDLTLAIAEPSGLAMIYVETCTLSSSPGLRLDIGARLDMARSATGQAYLTAATEERARLMKELSAWHGKEWPVLRVNIDNAKKQIEERGFVYSDGQWRPDTRAVAAPLISADGSKIYAVNCAAPRFAVSEERMVDELGPRLVVLCKHLKEVLI